MFSNALAFSLSFQSATVSSRTLSFLGHKLLLERLIPRQLSHLKNSGTRHRWAPSGKSSLSFPC